MVEAAKKIAIMWKEMGELLTSDLFQYFHIRLVDILVFSLVFRKECVHKERNFKGEIVDLAKSINKESQEVEKIAKSTAEVCTDKTMKHVSCLNILWIVCPSPSFASISC